MMSYDNRNCYLMLLLMTHPSYPLTLSEDRIDIWQCPLNTLSPNAHQILSQDEMERANRYYFEKHRRRFIMARASLRIILSQYLQIPPDSVEFIYNKYGKPLLKHHPDLQFNLSHSGELAILGVGKTHALGVDLEFFSARPYEGIAKELFSIQEIAALEHTHPSMRTLAFFHIWAQKEAFIKASGLGLSYPTQTFDVSIILPNHQLIWDNKHQCQWQIHTFIPTLMCCAAICHHPSVSNIAHHIFSADAFFLSLSFHR